MLSGLSGRWQGVQCEAEPLTFPADLLLRPRCRAGAIVWSICWSVLVLALCKLLATSVVSLRPCSYIQESNIAVKTKWHSCAFGSFGIIWYHELFVTSDMTLGHSSLGGQRSQRLIIGFDMLWRAVLNYLLQDFCNMVPAWAMRAPGISLSMVLDAATTALSAARGMTTDRMPLLAA